MSGIADVSGPVRGASSWRDQKNNPIAIKHAINAIKVILLMITPLILTQNPVHKRDFVRLPQFCYCNCDNGKFGHPIWVLMNHWVVMYTNPVGS